MEVYWQIYRKCVSTGKWGVLVYRLDDEHVANAEFLARCAMPGSYKLIKVTVEHVEEREIGRTQKPMSN